MARRKLDRPTLLERLDRFLEAKSLNELIEPLDLAYKQTQNENVLKVLRYLQNVRDRRLAAETAWRQEEKEEALQMIGALPYSVVTYLLYYEEKDNE